METLRAAHDNELPHWPDTGNRYFKNPIVVVLVVFVHASMQPSMVRRDSLFAP
jgi:hypothetical protein